MHVSSSRCTATPTTVSMSLTTLPPALRLLKLINPKDRPTIPLDDLVSSNQRHLLLSIPQTSREQVRTALQAFILDHKAFRITPEQFIECVSQVPTVQSAPHRPVQTSANREARVSTGVPIKRELPLDFELHAAAPIPKSLKLRIRTLSQERQFIPYDGDLSLSFLKLSGEQQKPVTRPSLRGGHRRVTTCFVAEQPAPADRPYSVIHTRKNSQVRPCEQVQDRQGKHSPDSRAKTRDSSFVGSSATTPKKCAGPFNCVTSPVREEPKVVIPSLKAGMEKLLEVRQRYLEMSQKDEFL